jgi:hypothetical protein
MPDPTPAPEAARVPDGGAAITNANDIWHELQRRLTSRPFKRPDDMRPHLPRVHCADGFNVSVQANRYNYCTPRDDHGPWSLVELGFPSAPMPELAEWIESDDPNATDTVWGYVPLHRVAAVLASHGGLMPEAARGAA